MRAYWLVKSEPGTWSWQDQLAKGVEEWDGVRNHQAKKNLLAMNLGDQAFFYHSVKEKAIVGIVEVCATAHPDSTDPTGKWVAPDFRTLCPLHQAVTLAQIKQDERLQDMVLLKQSRLSVQPVTSAQWQIICDLGEITPP